MAEKGKDKPERKKSRKKYLAPSLAALGTLTVAKHAFASSTS